MPHEIQRSLSGLIETLTPVNTAGPPAEFGGVNRACSSPPFVYLDNKATSNEHIFPLAVPEILSVIDGKMSSDLSEAMERLHLENDSSFETIDDVLFDRVVRPPKKQDPDELRAELEKKYLSPSTTFSTEWLNRLQQRWETPTDYSLSFRIAPTQTRTVTRFIRHGLEGRVTGYRNVTVPASQATAKTSTSLLRKPASRADFVRGAAGFFPFAPGGLEGIEATASLEDQLRSSSADDGDSKRKLERVITLGEGGLLEVAPGLSRGIDFSKKRKLADAGKANDKQRRWKTRSPRSPKMLPVVSSKMANIQVPVLPRKQRVRKKTSRTSTPCSPLSSPLSSLAERSQRPTLEELAVNGRIWWTFGAR
jgi:hypothetical protein